VRILQIIEASAAGVGRHLTDLLGELQYEDCELHLAYSPRRMDRAFARRLGELRNTTASQIEVRRRPHFSDVRALRYLRDYIKQYGPFDIIHGHSTKGGLLARFLSRYGAAVVYTPNAIYTMNPFASGMVRRVVGTLERRMVKRTDAIIAVSPEEQAHIESLGIPSNMVHCIVNGVDPTPPMDRNEARRELGLSQEDVLIGFVGRFSQQKDPMTFVRALGRLVEQGHRFRAAVVGTGELEHDIRSLAEELGVGDRIHWLGYDTAQMTMSAVDVFALSSRYEGMPYVLIEALGAGLPIVTTEVAGARLAVEDGKNGFVVPVGDSNALAARLEQLISNTQYRADMAVAARVQADQFSARRMAQETFALYRDLARNGSARSTRRDTYDRIRSEEDPTVSDEPCQPSMHA